MDCVTSFLIAEMQVASASGERFDGLKYGLAIRIKTSKLKVAELKVAGT